VIFRQYSISESTGDDSDKDKSYTLANIFDTLSHDSNHSVENEAETTDNIELVLNAITENSEFPDSAQKRIKISHTKDHSVLTQDHIPEHGLFISPSNTAENETDQCMYYNDNCLLINILFSYEFMKNILLD